MLPTPVFPLRRLVARGFATLAAACLFPAAALHAQNTIHVPADQPTIQAGINAASTGDTVLVAPGTYYENIDFKGKAITVTSAGGAASTIIDGGNKGTVVYVGSATGTNATLQGFTIQHGVPEQSHPGYPSSANYGGGVVVVGDVFLYENTIQNNASCGVDIVNGDQVSVSGNHILNNIPATTMGADCRIEGFGILVHSPEQVGAVGLQGNLIESNFDGGIGVSAGTYQFDCFIQRNTIRANGMTGSAIGGVGVSAGNTRTFVWGNLITGNRGVGVSGGQEIDDNTLYGNSTDTSTYASAADATEVRISNLISLYVPYTTDVENNIIVGTSPNFPAVYSADPASTQDVPAVWDHNLIYNTATKSGFLNGLASPGVGNIFVDPMFKAAGSDFHLQPGSPAIDSGNNSPFGGNDVRDIDGSPRLQDAGGKGYSIVDMGAYEYTGASTVTPTELVMNLASASTSSYVPAGATVSLDVIDSQTANLPGSATLLEDGNPIATQAFAGDQATFTTPPLSSGYHRFWASYPGQGSASPVTSEFLWISVGPSTTQLTLTSSLNPSPSGQSVTFTVTITSPDGAILSPIALADGSTTLATLTPNSSGVATCSTSSLALGYHTITASYAGDSTHNSAEARLTQQIVNPYATITAVSGTPNPSIVNGSVTMTATVTSSSSGGSPTGTVAFTYGATPLGSVTVTGSSSGNSATATINTAALPAGSDTVTATYTPTGSFTASSGSYIQQVLSGYATTITLVSGNNPSNLGQPVTFASSVVAQNSGYGVPTGSIAFAVAGGATFATVPLDFTGNARATTSTLPRGSNGITATYIPTGNFAGSSASLTQTVNGLTPAATLQATPATLTYGSAVTLSVAVAASSGGTPTGTVAFYDGAMPLGSITLASGAGTLVVTPTSTGAHTYTCHYSGDFTFNPTLCNSASVMVNAVTTVLLLHSSANPSPALSQVIFDAAVAAGQTLVPGAPVVFTVDGTSITVTADASGNAKLSVSLAVGAHSVTAAFAGDTNHTGSTNTLTETAVANPTTTALVAAPNPAYQYQPVTFVASIHPSTGSAQPYGSVVLLDSGMLLANTIIPPGQPAASATFALAGLSPGAHTLTATYTAADANFTASTSAPVSVTILPQDAVLSTDTPTLTVQAEHHNHLNLELTSIGGLAGAFTLSCGTLPAWAHCYLGQPALTLTSAASLTVSTTLEIDTDAVYHFKSALEPPHLPGRPPASRLPLLALLPLALLPLSGPARRRKLRSRLRAALAASAALLFLVSFTTGCGDRYPSHTEPGAYTVQVTAASVPGTTPAPMTRTTSFTLVVTP